MKHIVLILIVALGLAATTHAQPPAGAPRVCAPTNSEKATVAAIAADPAAWMGRCVSVEAIYSGERLNVDADAIYGVNGNSIGGYVDGKGDVGGAWTGTFTGRVADCARAEEDLLTGLLRSPGISLHGRTLGCLEPKGPFLVFMTHAGMKPAGIKRRLPGAKGGDLVEVGQEWPHYDAVTGVANNFAEAFDIGRPDGLVVGAYEAQRLLEGNGSVFDKAKPLTGRPLTVFIDSDDSVAEKFSAEACWCLKPNCAKLWPIDSRDADNQPTRPYACVRVRGRELEPGMIRFGVDTSHDVYGLDEP